jgi:hypothetical protein
MIGVLTKTSLNGPSYISEMNTSIQKQSVINPPRAALAISAKGICKIWRANRLYAGKYGTVPPVTGSATSFSGRKFGLVC